MSPGSMDTFPPGVFFAFQSTQLSVIVVEKPVRDQVLVQWTSFSSCCLQTVKCCSLKLQCLGKIFAFTVKHRCFEHPSIQLDLTCFAPSFLCYWMKTSAVEQNPMREFFWTEKHTSSILKCCSLISQHWRTSLLKKSWIITFATHLLYLDYWIFIVWC